MHAYCKAVCAHRPPPRSVSVIFRLIFLGRKGYLRCRRNEVTIYQELGLRVAVQKILMTRSPVVQIFELGVVSKIARDCNFRDTLRNEQQDESQDDKTYKQFPATPDIDISPCEQFLILITNLHEHNVKIP